MEDLLRVIDIWMDGDSTLEDSLWGMSMIWWGRVGKAVAYIAALVVVLDFIGATRMRSFADRVGNLYGKFKRWTSPSISRRPRTDDQRRFEERFAASTVVLVCLVGSLTAPMAHSWQLIFMPIFAALAVYLWQYMLMHVIGILATAVLAPFFLATVIFLDVGKFITWIGHKALGGDGYGNPLRVGAVFIGLLGFLLDLLAT